jgi:hypothetical protein
VVRLRDGTGVVANISNRYPRRGNRLYRYYVSTIVIKRGPEACTIRRVPAAEIEAAIIDQVRALELVYNKTSARHFSYRQQHISEAEPGTAAFRKATALALRSLFLISA